MYLEIVGTGAGGSTPGCVLVCDQQSYLFNVGGGTQRLCLEHGVRLARVRSIFLTRLVAETVGGLPGMLLTVEDMGCDTMHIHGPRGTGRFMEGTRYFCRPNTTLVAHDWGSASPSNTYSRAALSLPGVRQKLGLLEDQPLDDGKGKLESAQQPEAPENQPEGLQEKREFNRPVKVREYRGPVSKALDLRNLQIASSAHRSISEYRDDNIRVIPVLVQPVELPESRMQDEEEKQAASAADEVQYELPPAPKLFRPLPTSVSGTPEPLTAISYIIHTADIPGKFLPQRALQLWGLRPGPEFGRLQRGEVVEIEVTVYEDDGSLVPPIKERKARKSKNVQHAEQGPAAAPAEGQEGRATRREKRVVRPEDVMEESRPGPMVCIVDCPTLGHAAALVRDQAFVGLRRQQPEGQPIDPQRPQLSMVCHMCPEQVWSSPPYQDWVRSFGSTVQHVLLHAETSQSQSVFRASDVIYQRLAIADPEIFPSLPEFTAGQHRLADRELSANVTRGEMNLQFLIKPPERSGLLTDRCLKPITPEEIEPSEEFLGALVEARGRVQHLQLESQSPQAEAQTTADPQQQQQQAVWQGLTAVPEGLSPTITFLGTGCASPSKYRNVSAIHLQIQPGCAALLDCGEGTYGQMLRRWGLKETEERLLQVRLIWISHMHADHHLGLLRVLAARTQAALRQPPGALVPPVLVMAPFAMGWWLEEFTSVTQEPVQFEFMDNDQFLFNKGPVALLPHSMLPEVLRRCCNRLQDCGLVAVYTVVVDHCPFAYGVTLEHVSGWKLVYSGDAKPTPRLIEAGAGATVLIHEATFEDDMQEEAHRKNHSTTSEAVNMGLAMGANAVLLTHFSQRYPKIAAIKPEHMDTAIVAFDLMRVAFRNLHWVPALLPALAKIFDENEAAAAAAAATAEQQQEDEEQAPPSNKRLKQA